MANPLPAIVVPEVSTVEKIPQPHGGALNAGGTKGNRGHILRKRKQHVAWLALQELIRRLKEQPGEMLDKNLIAAAQLDDKGAAEINLNVGLQIQFVRERSEATSSDTEPQP